MGLPYDFYSELSAIHEEKMAADGVDPSEEERLVILENRAEQFGLILGRTEGRYLRSCGAEPQELKKILGIAIGQIPDDGTLLKFESVIAEAMVQAGIEFREFLGLDQSKKKDA
jgi:hypothetical protein